MRTYLKRLAAFFAMIAAVPLLVGVTGAFSAGLGIILLLFGGIALVAVLLVGSSVLFIEGIRGARQSPSMAAKLVNVFATPALLAVTIVLSWGLLGAGSWLGELARLGLNRGHYEAIIAKAQAGKGSTWDADDAGVKYAVDTGPPVRVAFNPEGVLDNWSGIVFDPTGDVMKAHGFDASGRFFAPERITKLFGGDLVSCRHLWGDYYDCSFT